ncbi:hypothetical protein Q8W13_02465 [Photobacterium damselae subsp. piscicida]|nr:hypothetical protein [Photobacterium damselae subsp. piscicida]
MNFTINKSIGVTTNSNDLRRNPLASHISMQIEIDETNRPKYEFITKKKSQGLFNEINNYFQYLNQHIKKQKRFENKVNIQKFVI